MSLPSPHNMPKDRRVQTKCPICGEFITKSSFDEHLALEKERINNGSSPPPTKRKSVREAAIKARINVLCQRRNRHDHATDEFASKRMIDDTLLRVRNDRVKRRNDMRECKWYRTKLDKLDAAEEPGFIHPEETETLCIICGQTLVGDYIAINSHVEDCIEREAAAKQTKSSHRSKKRGRQQEIVAWDMPFETYTIGGEERVRASSFLPPAVQSLSATTVNTHIYEDIDVDIDDDDTAAHGAPQFSESDLVGEDDEVHDSIPPTTTSTDELASMKALVDALKAQLKKPASAVTCNVCLDLYTNPLVSINCWHVYCEKCWLRTLGTKRLCPQCNMITAATDLRRIFL